MKIILCLFYKNGLFIYSIFFFKVSHFSYCIISKFDNIETAVGKKQVNMTSFQLISISKFIIKLENRTHQIHIRSIGIKGSSLQR